MSDSVDPTRHFNSDETSRAPRDDASEGAADDPRILAAVKEYMAAVEAGRRPNRRELIARHPDIAMELSECLQGLAMVESAAAEMERDTGAPKPAAASGPVGPEAEPLGDFRLIREIGRGGMGVVYEAIQLSLGRRVALKVLPLAGALDPRQLQRFRNEAQAAAQLHHTNIVPVYAVGYERSTHFYAMQLIEGQSLAEVIQELRQTTGKQKSELSVAPTAPPPASASSVSVNGPSDDESDRGRRWQTLVDAKSGSRPRPTQNLSAAIGSKKQSFFQTVARLGMQAAEALEYAHQLGVVHRDIKPANLLLDVHGTLWITDFGLAQLTTEAGAAGNLTQPGDMLGTLRYMSPEQATGKAVVLDQRTDVYSLGLTLYELLTLERALPGETRDQLLYQIGYVDPKPPRSIDRTIPPELETILAKATAKDPAERYANAKALADDLRRFLHNEPILARPPSLWDQAIKWTRRHRAVTISAIVVLVLTAVASIVSSVLIQGAYVRERERADEVTQQRIRADRSLSQALEAVDYFIIAAEELPKEPQFLVYRRNLLDTALDYYQNFVNEHQHDAIKRTGLGDAQRKIDALMTEIDSVDQLSRLVRYKTMLRDPEVRTELKLTAEEGTRALAMSETGAPNKSTATTRPLNAMSVEERQAMLSESIRVDTEALNKVLTPPQFKRLREIARQARGLDAFDDTDVLGELALTKEQRETVANVQSAAREREHQRMGIGPGPGGPGGGGPRRFGPGGPPPERPQGAPDDNDDEAADRPQGRRPFPPPNGPPRDRRPGGPGFFPDRPRFRGGPFRDGESQEKRDAEDAQDVATVVATFTESQKATWRALIGEPTSKRIHLEDEFHRGGPRGPHHEGPPPRQGPPPEGPPPDEG